ncbi:MAG TPA: acyl-CoA dehydrogenase family protein [Acidimicrobiia bacterium]|nr:acyl-CoA dehydrogenase family protein [Acidimicrobiia bacterium]
MDLQLPDSDQLLAGQARSLLGAAAPPGRLAEWEADALGFDRAQWARLVQLGWPGVALPEASGGGGGSLVSLGVLAAEIGRAAYPSPFLPTVTAGLVAARLGTTKRAGGLVESIARDGIPAALAWTPGGGADLTAQRRGGALVCSGRLVVEWAQVAETLVCLAPLPEGVAVVAIDAGAPGLRISPRRSFDNERVAVVELDGVEVPPGDHLVAGGVAGAAEVADALGAVRLVRAAELVGGAEKTLELTAAYVGGRVQFGVPIGTFQAVQHACADVAMLVAGARLATDEGLAGGRPPRRAGAVAGYLAGRAAVAAAVTAAQLHGGVGMIRDYPLHFYYRRAKAMQLRLGAAAAQLEELARVLVDPVVEAGGSPGPWL